MPAVRQPDCRKAFGRYDFFLECLLLPESFGHLVERCTKFRNLPPAWRSLERHVRCGIPRDLSDSRRQLQQRPGNLLAPEPSQRHQNHKHDGSRHDGLANRLQEPAAIHVARVLQDHCSESRVVIGKERYRHDRHAGSRFSKTAGVASGSLSISESFAAIDPRLAMAASTEIAWGLSPRKWRPGYRRRDGRLAALLSW